MSDYPKFTWDKVPDMLSELSEKCEENTRRQMRYIPMPDPYVPSMSFEKFIELMPKRRTKDCTRIVFSFNPDDKEHWLFKFINEYLKENGADQ